MGNDTPLAVLSDRRPLLYSYFKQLFAQVTNPPIDPIREAVVMSKQSLVGSERNLLDETPEHARQLVIDNPILRDDELERLRQVESDVFRAQTIDITWPVAEGVSGLEPALERICAEADEALARGREHPRPVGSRDVVPSACRCRRSSRSGPCTTISSGRGRDSRPASSSSRASRAACRASPCSIGYGAAAVNPYLMLATIDELVADGRLELEREDAQQRALQAIGKGLLKTISKMGISTLSSYCGAQVFEAIGLSTRTRRALFHRHALAHRRHRTAGAGRRCAFASRARVPGRGR